MLIANLLGTLSDALLLVLTIACFVQGASAWGLDLDRALLRRFYDGGDNRQRSSAFSSISAIENATVDDGYLVDAVTSYMNLFRDTAIYYIYMAYFDDMDGQRRPNRDHHRFAANPSAELSPSEANHSRRGAVQIALKSNLRASIANYERVFRVRPGIIGPAIPPFENLPRTLQEAINASQIEQTSIRSARAALAVASCSAAVARKGFETGSCGRVISAGPAASESFRQVLGPLYDSAVMHSGAFIPDSYGTAKARLDGRREAVRRSVISAWVSYSGSEVQIEKDHAAVLRQERAFERAHVKGNATMTRIAKVRRGLLHAQIALVVAQRNRIIASYVLLDAMGRLSLEALETRHERREGQALADGPVAAQGP